MCGAPWGPGLDARGALLVDHRQPRGVREVAQLSLAAGDARADHGHGQVPLVPPVASLLKGPVQEVRRQHFDITRPGRMAKTAPPTACLYE